MYFLLLLCINGLLWAGERISPPDVQEVLPTCVLQKRRGVWVIYWLDGDNHRISNPLPPPPPGRGMVAEEHDELGECEPDQEEQEIEQEEDEGSAARPPSRQSGPYNVFDAGFSADTPPAPLQPARRTPPPPPPPPSSTTSQPHPAQQRLVVRIPRAALLGRQRIPPPPPLPPQLVRALQIRRSNNGPGGT